MDLHIFYIYVIYIDMSSSIEAPVFNVCDYLDRRTGTSPFVMIEFGHGPYPLVANCPDFFNGERAYIGIEACMRSGKAKGERRREDFSEYYDDINAIFLTHDLGGSENEFAVSSDEWYEGAYEAETVLCDGAGDEVVASNVFCDPYIGRNFDRTNRLLGEMSRLAGDGVIVLRETLTPSEVRYVNYVASHLGLETLAEVTPRDSFAWERLESFYGTHKEQSSSSDPRPDGYYLFLAQSVRKRPEVVLAS